MRDFMINDFLRPLMWGAVAALGFVLALGVCGAMGAV